MQAELCQNGAGSLEFARKLVERSPNSAKIGPVLIELIELWKTLDHAWPSFCGRSRPKFG